MITRQEYEKNVEYVCEMFKKAGIKITADEKAKIEVADFGLGRLDEIGLQLLTYINTERVCAKEMVLKPYQTCPEHRHVPTNGKEGKEETFRCRYGKVYLYVDGDGKIEDVKAKIPNTKLTVFHQIELNEGEQYTIYPNTKHWFQAGSDGAIVSEFSTRSTDETDVFSDKEIVRETKFEQD